MGNGDCVANGVGSSGATRGYKDLIVWQRAMDLVPIVYRVMRRLPSDERFGLVDQARRAVVSVAANIAEGQARQYPAEFAHGLSVARGSLAELDTLLLAAVRLGYLRENDVAEPMSLITDIRRMLQRLIQTVRARPRT